MGIRGELFSSRVILPNRTYFFNVKENRMNDIYLNIVESKNRDSGGFDRQSVILFADDLQEFLKGFDDSLRAMEKAVREKRQSGKVSGKSAKRDDKFARTENRDGKPRDRADRPENKNRRPDRADRPDRKERSDRYARPDQKGNFPRGRSEKPERKERPDQIKSFSRDRSDRPFQSKGNERGRKGGEQGRDRKPGFDRSKERGDRNRGGFKPGAGKRVVVKKRD